VIVKKYFFTFYSANCTREICSIDKRRFLSPVKLSFENDMKMSRYALKVSIDWRAGAGE